MALFETMRNNTKIILWITVVAFVVGLVLLQWGAGFSGGNPGQDREAGVLAKVNGERVMYAEYRNMLQKSWGAFEAQTGERPDESMVLRLEASTWENLIDQVLVRQEVAERGIRVSQEEIARGLLSNPPREILMNPAFRDTSGQFDARRYQGWLASLASTAPLEAEQRMLEGQKKLQLQILAGVKVSDQEIRDAWLEREEKSDLAYGMISYFKVLPDAEVSDEEIRAFIQENEDDYRLPTRVAMLYVHLPKEVSEQDSLDAYAEIREALAELKRGEEFDVLVKDYTQAPPNRQGGEAAMLLTRQQIPQTTVADSAFAMEIGRVSAAFTSQDGFHIIRVDERTTEEDVEKVKIAEIFIPLEMSIDTNIQIRDRVIDLADSSGAMGFEEAASSFGLTAENTGLLDPEGYMRGLQQVRAARDFAKDAEIGEVSKPIQTTDAWYLLYLTERRGPEMPPFEEVKTRAQSACLLEKRKVAAKAQAERLLAQVRQGLALEDAAATDSLATYNTSEGATRSGFVRGIGSDPHVTGAAFAAPDSGLVPIVVMGNQGAYVVETRGRVRPAEEAFATAREELQMQLLREKQNRVLTEWMESLRARAEIVDYRFAVTSL